MKKSILSLCFVLIMATLVNAAPRFGVIFEQTKGAGVYLNDDMFTGELTVGAVSDTANNKTELTNISVALNYKIALDAAIAFTTGIGYEIHTGKVGSNYDASVASESEIELSNLLAIQVGIERALSSNLILTAEVDAFSIANLKYKGSGEAKVKTTRFFSNSRIGIAYLF